MKLFKWTLLIALNFIPALVLAEAPAGLRILSGTSIGHSALVRVQTPEGVHNLRLKRIAAPRPKYLVDGQAALESAQPLGLKLFRGRVQGRVLGARNNRAAASIDNGQLEIVFFGRRKRLFTHTEDISGAQKLIHLPSSYTRACGLDSQSASFATAGLETTTAFSPNRYLDISTDADAEYAAALGGVAGANSRIQSTINSVSAIYTSQLGIELQLVSQNVFTNAGTQPYTSSNSLTLLETFRSHTLSSRHLSASDAYHLFTGKDVESNVVGLAYLSAVCNPFETAFGLSQRVSTAIQYIVVAHEIGHNLGADHDNGPPSLMSPVVSPGTDEFSAQSLTEINDFLGSDPDCLSQTPTTGVSLSTRVRGSGRITFRAELDLINLDPSGCTLELYGARGAAKLADGVIESANLLISFPLSAATTIFKANIKEGDSEQDQKSARFRAKVICGGDTYFSSITEESIYPYNTGKIKPFFTKIAAKIGPI